jgi:hypothetical protein
MRLVGVDRANGHTVLEIGGVAYGQLRVQVKTAVVRLQLNLAFISGGHAYQRPLPPQVAQFLADRRKTTAIHRGIKRTAQVICWPTAP